MTAAVPPKGPRTTTAIATDKTAYMPNSTLAAFNNVSSYTRGINGIMVDLAGGGDHASINANDFVFKVGNNNSPNLWSAVTATPTISVRLGQGTLGSDRVTITWASGSIRNKWLEVQVLPTANTGLTATDVFFWGNKVGDTGQATPAGDLPHQRRRQVLGLGCDGGRWRSHQHFETSTVTTPSRASTLPWRSARWAASSASTSRRRTVCSGRRRRQR